MKLVPVLLLVVLWAGCSSSPVKPERGIASTLSNGARYIGKKLHIIKKRQTPSAGESKELKANAQEAVGSEDQNQSVQTGMSSRAKRAQGSDDPRYILVHDVPPCKKRRSVEDYEPLPACNTHGGKNITIIIQNTMEGTGNHRVTRGAVPCSNPSKAAAETDRVGDLKLAEASEEENSLGDNSGEWKESAPGRKLLWAVEDNESPFLEMSQQRDPFFLNLAATRDAIDTSLNDQQQHFTADQKLFENANVQIGQVASHAICVCVVTNMKCGGCVSAFRVWEPADSVNCTRACSGLADCCCEESRAGPSKTQDSDIDDGGISGRGKHLDQALYLEVAWIIILMLNILVGINTIVIGYVCWKGPNKKKSVYLVHGYANIPPARA